jgi:hypothetical protein
MKELIAAMALTYLPILSDQIAQVWPDAPFPAVFGGQVDKETCSTMQSKKCWNPEAENKPKKRKEYGFGFGQITITDRFNRFEEITRLDPILKKWKYENRFDPHNQLRALIVVDKLEFTRIKDAIDDLERTAFMLSAYNGGGAGLINDRKYCQQFEKCNYRIWFGHVEKYSRKARTSSKAYNKSHFHINREYVSDIFLRSQRYIPHLGAAPEKPG